MAKQRRVTLPAEVHFPDKPYAASDYTKMLCTGIYKPTRPLIVEPGRVVSADGYVYRQEIEGGYTVADVIGVGDIIRVSYEPGRLHKVSHIGRSRTCTCGES